MRYLRQANFRRFVWAACLSLMALGRLAADESPAFNEGKWPFTPLKRPAVPVVRSSGVANPIDAFILHALAEQGLEPSAAADKLTLLRRVTFDLTGLPPTVAQQQAFLNDSSPDAYRRVVDRLLDSPQYGERWAQHWLDVVRYSESDGFKEDAYRPTAYKYRDYVIRALNADLPLDRFISQQLAGDELEPDNPEAIVATGLNRLYPDEYNAANVRQRRQEIRDDLTENTGLALLGLTIGCAQCHDHKFDPISQVDYFRLQAFFAPLLPRDDMPLGSVDERRQYTERLAAWEDATRAIREEIEALVAPKREAAMTDALEKFTPDIREAMKKPVAERTALDEQLCVQAMKYVTPKLREVVDKGLKGEAKQRYDELRKQLAEFDSLKPKELPTAMAAVDAPAAAPATFRLTLGDYRKPLEEVQPGFPKFLGDAEPKIVPVAGGASSGRRAALARWLVRPDHPLTARVMVNRLWQHHFGEGIVATPNDFGATGDPPSHPELLDWLAAELVESGWSAKAMHRLMVTSATYQQASRVNVDDPRHAKALQVDGANRLLWHARPMRLEGEALRDAMLAVSEQMNAKMFGASERPELPKGIDGKLAWKADAKSEDRNRRSIYVIAKRNLRYPLLDIFDAPDMHNSCAHRPATTTAPQALALLNGELSVQLAQHWSGRLLSETGADRQLLVRQAWQEAFARPPRDDEALAAQAFLTRQAAKIAEGGTPDGKDLLPTPQPEDIEPAQAAAVVDFCHAIFNANEFLFID